jgi:signal transduction histidine kinase/ligand-binding sensor domain-containing protein
MNGKIVFPVLTCLVLCVHLSCAQQYLFTRFTPKDGLVNNRARFMFQDSKGRLYISTYGGSVYDGSRFTNYTTENGLATSLINDIAEMGDDSLWIMPNGSAIHCMVHGIIRDLRTMDNFYPVTNQLLKTSDGQIYSIADEGLYHFEKNRFVKIPIMGRTASGEEKDAGILLVQAVEYKGLLVILTDPFLGIYPGSATILVYNPRTGKSIVPKNPLGAYFLVKSPEGDLLVTTRYGLRKLDPDSLSHNRVSLISPPFPYQTADSLFSSFLYFDRSKNLWLSSGDAIQKIDREGRQHTFNTANGLPAGINNSIFQDGEDNMWFTNDQNGITMLASQEVEFYAEPAPGFLAQDLYADERSDSTWFYNAPERSLLLETREGQKVFHGTGELPEGGGQIVMGKKAYLITGDDLYALHFLPGKNEFRGVLIHRRDEDRGDPNGSTYSSALFDHGGNLVLTSAKLGVLLSGRLHQVPIRYRADQSAIDRQDRIWTVTRADELFVFRRGVPDTALQLLHCYNEGMPKIGPRSITVDGTGHVWIGTRDHGLYCLFFDGLRLLSWTRLTTKNGLSENFVNYLECDANNTIWACTPGGVDKIRLEKGHFIINNVTRSNAIYRSIYKIVPTRGGVHWALATRGIIKISPPAGRNEHYLPSVLFSRVLVGNEAVTDFRKGLTLPYDRNAISFYVGATTFIDETQTRYTYLLEGSQGAKWSTPSDQSAINLIDLPPGKYTLRVKALFLTGRYPEQSAAYSFVITPPWWQTWWFRAVVALALIGLSLLLIRRYIRRKLEKQRTLLEKKQAVEKERTRIATDMHDDLGAGLSRIKFLSETIGIKKQQQLPIEEEISGIRQYSHDMIDKMGEIVWALNERNDSLSDLLSYTRSYAVEYLMQAGIVCEVEGPPADLPTRFVGGEFRRNVYLTIKEALHNIVKHSQAGKVFISMEVNRTSGTTGKTGKGENLIIVIRDNGIGFDKNHIRPFSNGLNNMEKRITGLGGNLVIGHGPITSGKPCAGGVLDPVPGSYAADGIGTSVRLFVPV